MIMMQNYGIHVLKKGHLRLTSYLLYLKRIASFRYKRMKQTINYYFSCFVSSKQLSKSQLFYFYILKPYLITMVLQ